MKRIKVLVILTAVVVTTVSITTIDWYCFHHKSTGKISSESQVLISSGVTSEADRVLSEKNDEISKLQYRNHTLQEDIKKVTHFVNINDVDSNITVNLKYATSDNCTGNVLYPVSVCVLREETARKLENAESKFLERGYHIEVWDAYRPLSVQKLLYAAAKDPTYIADPATGSRHNRGAAVDITLMDKDNNELEMPSGFDDFTDKAHRDNSNMSAKAKENMNLLTSVMIDCGFTTINSEWWHFDDSDYNNYPVLDVSLEDFEE